MPFGLKTNTITAHLPKAAAYVHRDPAWAEAVNVLHALDSEGVVYCLLRPGLVVKGANAFELDILVRPRDLPVVARVLAASGFGPLATRGYPPHHFSARRCPDGTRLKLDVVDDLRFGFGRSLRCVPANRCLATRWLRGGVYFLSPEYEFLRVVCSALLNVKWITTQHRKRLQELALEVSGDLASLSTQINPYLAPALRCEEVVRAISNSDWQWLAGKRRTLRNRLIWKSPWSTAWRAVWACALRTIWSSPVAARFLNVDRRSHQSSPASGTISTDSHVQGTCQ